MDKVHVLNTGLYNAMRAAYGSVRLYKSGETARYDEDAGTALDGGGDSYARDVKGGERYVVDCPYCGRNDRLWVSYLAGAFAEGRGRRIRFPRSLVICHGCLFQRDAVRYRDFWSRLETAGYVGDATLVAPGDAEPSDDGGRPEAPDRPPAEILPACVPLTGAGVPGAVGDWLRGRGIDPAALERELGACWSHDPKGRGYGVGRIVFPVWQDRRIVGWQGRCLDRDVGPGEPKYWFPSGSRADLWLYNRDRARWCDPVVLTEGVLDVFKVGPAGVARFGKATHPRQLALLRALWGSRSVVYLPDGNDPQAIDKAREEAVSWRTRGLFEGGVHLAYLPRGRDPGDMTREEIREVIREQTGKVVP